MCPFQVLIKQIMYLLTLIDYYLYIRQLFLSKLLLETFSLLKLVRIAVYKLLVRIATLNYTSLIDWYRTSVKQIPVSIQLEN